MMRRIPRLVSFLGYYAAAFVVASLNVALWVIRPLRRMRPAILAVPIDSRTDAEITMLAHLVTITPGSVVVGVSPDRRFLFVHVLSTDDPDRDRRELHDNLERRVLEILR